MSTQGTKFWTRWNKITTIFDTWTSVRIQPKSTKRPHVEQKISNQETNHICMRKKLGQLEQNHDYNCDEHCTTHQNQFVNDYTWRKYWPSRNKSHQHEEQLFRLPVTKFRLQLRREFQYTFEPVCKGLSSKQNVSRQRTNRIYTEKKIFRQVETRSRVQLKKSQVQNVTKCYIKQNKT